MILCLRGKPLFSLIYLLNVGGKIWYSYLTSVLEPEVLPPYVVAELYGQRWRTEEVFNTVKRLLGLSCLWTGSWNGIELQLWGTWLFYGVLVDLGDTVADELALPFEKISLEMIYRGLYHWGKPMGSVSIGWPKRERLCSAPREFSTSGRERWRDRIA